ncbi:MAG: ABC transporter permease, partial [Chthonomonadaceae bacterium]|nr:ABC transporter permease [Chthonomonadaceae bacterium]
MEPQNRRISLAYLIFRKEFLEIFRDRRTLMSVVIGPLVLTPMLFALMGPFIERMRQKAEKEQVRVGVVGSEQAPGFFALLKALPNTTLEPVPVEVAESTVRERTYRAVIVIPSDADQTLASGRSVGVQVLLDEGNQESQEATQRLKVALSLIGETILKQRLQARNLPADFATPIQVKEKPIASGGNAGLVLLSVMLPYILIISAFSGAIYAAFDQVAGEKERGTLETLLVSPASRGDIVLGKFTAVVAVCLITGVLTVAGLIITFTSRLQAFAWLSKGGMSISPSTIGVVLLVMLPLSVLFAGLLLAVSTFARNQKEAQTYLFPIMTLILLP